MVEPQVPCRNCQGAGMICGPVRAVGVSWATPWGIPDWDERVCEVCNGDGSVEYGMYYLTLEDAVEANAVLEGA